MKVLLNVESLAPPVTGVGTYVRHLLAGLRSHPQVEAVQLFSRTSLALPGSAGRVAAEPDGTDGGSRPAGMGFVPASLRSRLRALPFTYALRDRFAGYRLRRAGWAHEGYLYHEPNGVAVAYDGPCVVTVADLSHLYYPQAHPPGRVRWLASRLGDSIASAGSVICHSEAVRDEIVKEFAVPPERIHVVYHGVDAAFRPHTAAELQPVLQLHGLKSSRYVLSVGTLEPRKNLAGLVQAYAMLSPQLRLQHPLVLAGARGWLTAAIEQAMRPLEREGSLRWLGYVDFDDLPAIYAGAHAFAYPSFYEGFGLPIIEAMASGVPVLTSDCSSMPEVAGGAAVLAAPDAPEAMAEKLGRLLEDDSLRGRSITAGLERSRYFRWERCVAQTVDAYADALRAYGG